MKLGITRQNHVRCQNPVRICELFYAPHHRGGLLTPFRCDERRHVQAGSVLGLQRAVMFPDDEFHKLSHESRVPGQSVGLPKICDESEMKISMSCVSRDTGNESMLGK